MKQVAGSLKLFLAQYREVAAFAQFGSDLDASTQFLLNRGARLTELLKQDQYKPLPVEEQVSLIYCGVNGFLDKVETKRVTEFEKSFLPYMRTSGKGVLDSIKAKGQLDKTIEGELKSSIDAFFKTWQ
eukprot:NODE_80_length_22829_cov_0.188121.p9 type:complete len:128 gc:universal NODE_80_length_22829_cov_0.188121:2285-2668(+)